MASKTKISNKNQNAIFLMFRLLIILLFHQHNIRAENVKCPSGRNSGRAYVSSALFFKERPDCSETGIRESKIAWNAGLMAAINILA